MVFKTSNIKDDEIDILNKTHNLQMGLDRTSFESLENHIHITEKVKKRDFDMLCKHGEVLGELMLLKLKNDFPDRQFFVYVTVQVGDSMIIRFHQKWEDEAPWMDVEDPAWHNQKGFKALCFKSVP